MNLRSKAAVAGFLGGLAGACAMDQFTRMWRTIVPEPKQVAERRPPLPYSYQEWHSTSRTASRMYTKLFGRALTGQETLRGAQFVHFAVGGAAGATYALLIARKSPNMFTSGLLFGAILWLVGEELAMSVLKINDPPGNYGVEMHLNSLGEHLAFGLATSVTSKALIAML